MIETVLTVAGLAAIAVANGLGMGMVLAGASVSGASGSGGSGGSGSGGSGSGGSVSGSGAGPVYVRMGPAPPGKSQHFIAELEGLVDVWPQVKPLLDAIRVKDLKVSVFCPLGGSDEDGFFVMLVGHVDYKLEKLGQEHGICRGFPVRWVPGKLVRCFGFRPKFKNDDRQQAIESRFDAVAGFVKLSGFLSHLVTWVREDGTPCWSAFSKNSADSTLTLEEAQTKGCAGGFADLAARIWRPFVTERLIREMEESYTHVCAETMSEKYDAKHGAAPLQDIPVVTTMGRGVAVRKSGDTWEILNGLKKGYVNFFGFKETIHFCLKHKLPVCSAVIATGPAADMIMSRVGSGPERDFMTCDKYDALIRDALREHPGCVEYYQGSHSHKEVLGYCLEGVVWHAIPKGSGKTHRELVSMIETSKSVIVEKNKYPGYTGRTMLTREVFKKKPSPDCFEQDVEEWSSRWCISDEGKNYWMDFYWRVYLLSLQGDRHPEHHVAWHIRLCDHVDKMWSAMDPGSLESERDKVRVERELLMMKVPPRLTEKVTVVLPYSTQEVQDRVMADCYDAGFSTEKPKKGGWVNIITVPVKQRDKTGQVFQAPFEGDISGLEPWQTKKLSEKSEGVIQTESTEGTIQAICEWLKTKETPVDETGVEMEAKLREGTDLLVEELILLGQKPGGPVLVLTVGPQCSGKSTIAGVLEEKEGWVGCEADKFMGEVFKPGRLRDCHSSCQKKALMALLKGKNVIVSNTGMRAMERTIYSLIAKHCGARIEVVVLFPELWLTVSTPDPDFEKTLVKRSESRVRQFDKSAINVIRHTTESGRKDFNDSRLALEDWLYYFPVQQSKKSTVSVVPFKRTVLMEGPEIDALVDEALQEPRVQEILREFPDALLRKAISRGPGDNHITLVTPGEIRKPVVRDAKSKGVMEFAENPGPFTCKGIGRASGPEGDVYFLVLDWPWGQEYREMLGLTPDKDFHVTLFWTGEGDIHGVDKGTGSLEW